MYSLFSLSSYIIISIKPLNGRLNGFVHGSEFEVWQEFSKLCVARSLLVLAVGLVGKVNNISLKLKCLQHQLGHVSNRNFVGFVDRKYDRLNVFVIANCPNEKTSQIQGIDKLSQGFAGTPYGKIRAVSFGLVCFMNKSCIYKKIMMAKGILTKIF